jgi:DNA repair exonuclease SbcCD ATPase subunit
MSFFSIGNLLTLGIVAAVLILYRQLDKNNRSMDKVRKYGEKLKEDLSVFIAEKESAVRDYAIELDVQQKAAKELMNRLVLTDDALAGKAEAVARIDERISGYDKSLDELMKMTSRVEENLERIREESDFVESSAKKITEAKGRLIDLEKNLSDIEFRFERENAEALERTMEASVSAVKSTVSDMQATAETIERQVEDHREAVAKIEQQRAVNLARDTDIINKMLRDAVEKAGSKADKLEDAALIKLKEQALERTHRFKEEVEEKLKALQESAKVKILEVQGFVKSYKDEWKVEQSELEAKQKLSKEEWKKDARELNAVLTELHKKTDDSIIAIHNEIDAKQKLYKEEWKKDVQELNAAAENQKAVWVKTAADTNTEIRSTLGALNTAVIDLQKKVDESISSIDKQIKKTAETAEQKALEAAENKLEVYRAAQTEEFHRLESLSNDIVQLDAELRRYMQETEKRVRSDFALFEKDSADSRNASAAQFAASIAAIKTDMNGLEQELNALKNRAYENVSEKLKIFEDDFVADLAKRGDAVDLRLDEWEAGFDSALTELGESGKAARNVLEQNFTETLKTRFAETDGKILAQLDHLKAETNAFEEGIREQMSQADQSLALLREQLGRELEDARNAASSMVKTEIGKHELSMNELLKHSQRSLESTLKELGNYVENRNTEVTGLMDETRSSFADWKSKFALQLREEDERLLAVRNSIEGVRGEAETYRTELFSRTEEQNNILQTSIKNADRQIKEFINQTKLFDQAESLKTEIERSIEDLKADITRLDHQKAEIREMEAEFVRIKRLEDEVNAKMTRFMSEKRRIELMEADFNRLLTTSQAVEEKLVQVSSEDDTLQAMQVQLRHLHDALSEAEEKYQRIEKKNQTLEMTNDGIDRNFKILQETEGKVQLFDDSINRMQSDMANIQFVLGNLTKENEKVKLTQEKLSELDDTLVDVEKRIESMQVAREWLARTESRLAEVSKQAQDYVKLLGDLIKGETKKGMPKDRGAPPIGTRETVSKLAHQGWKVDEIARAVGISKGEVELIMEISPKD